MSDQSKSKKNKPSKHKENSHTVPLWKVAAYRYFGVYLAHKEQCKYMESKDFLKSIRKLAMNNKNTLGFEGIVGLLIGSWQIENKLSRATSFHVFSKNPFIRLYGNILTGIRTLKMDIKDFIESRKK